MHRSTLLIFAAGAALASLVSGCAPTPASITFDGGETAVTVHDKDGIPLKRATVRDADGKQIDPQPYLAWNVDHVDVVVLHDETLTPVGNGTAKVEARIGELSASYTVTVDLYDEPVETERPPYGNRPAVTYGSCEVYAYGNGIREFACDHAEPHAFPSGLDAYLSVNGSQTASEITKIHEAVACQRRPGCDVFLVVTRSD